MEKETKALLVESAERLISLKGFHNTKIEDITKDAGVAKGTFYTYFKSKEEVLSAIFEYRGLGYLEKIEAILKEPISFSKKLHLVTKYHIAFGIENKEFFRLMVKVFENFDRELGQMLKEKHFESKFVILRQIESIIKEGIESGGVDKKYSGKTLELANVYDSIRNQHLFFMFLKKNKDMCNEEYMREIFEAVDVDGEASFITDIFLNGIKNYGGE